MKCNFFDFTESASVKNVKRVRLTPISATSSNAVRLPVCLDTQASVTLTTPTVTFTALYSQGASHLSSAGMTVTTSVVTPSLQDIASVASSPVLTLSTRAMPFPGPLDGDTLSSPQMNLPPPASVATNPVDSPVELLLIQPSDQSVLNNTSTCSETLSATHGSNTSPLVMIGQQVLQEAPLTVSVTGQASSDVSRNGSPSFHTSSSRFYL